MGNARMTAALTAALLLGAAASVWAAPGIISYQGRLTDAGGDPITTALSVTFTFWDAEVGGNPLGAFSDTD